MDKSKTFLAGQRLRYLLLSAFLAFMVSAHADGAYTLADAKFPATVTVAETELQLTSLARLYYRVIFTGAAVGLYLSEPDDLSQVLNDVPKRLELEYFGAIPAQDFIDAANESLAGNLQAEMLEQLRDRIDAFNDLYVDIARNDRYAISYVPGHGTELSHNGEVLGRVEGADFAEAYFQIWFGPEPFNRNLKTSLLEGRR